MKIYLVGGAVRDKILGLTVKDRDWVVVGSNREEMLAKGYQEVGKDFPVFLHPSSKEEYALARMERKTAKGYQGFQFKADASVTLMQDLQRRDLTINAIAEDEQGHLIDPFNGLDDIDDGILRHVSKAFQEDPVRILRIARFSARYVKWGFRIAHSTHQLMKKMVQQGEVDALVAERVYQELEKALTEPHPEKFFSTLANCGALGIIMPEIAPLIASKQSHKNKIESKAIHSLIICCQYSQVSKIRLASLLQSSERKHLIQFCERLRIPKETKKLMLNVNQHYPDFLNILSLTAEALLTLLEKLDIYRNPKTLQDYLITCQAIATANDINTPPIMRKITAAVSLVTAITTKQLIDHGLKGKAFGIALRKLRIEALTNTLDQHLKSLVIDLDKHHQTP